MKQVFNVLYQVSRFIFFWGGGGGGGDRNSRKTNIYTNVQMCTSTLRHAVLVMNPQLCGSLQGFALFHIIKGMSTSVRFRSIIVDCGLGCPTRVSGGFLQSWARADSVVFVHHDSAVSIASLRDFGILPVRCAACFISCYILYVLMLCLVLFYVCMLLLCESCVFKVYVRFFSLLLCNNVCAC